MWKFVDLRISDNLLQKFHIGSLLISGPSHNHLVVVALVAEATLFKKAHIQLRRYKSDREEIWQSC